MTDHNIVLYRTMYGIVVCSQHLNKVQGYATERVSDGAWYTYEDGCDYCTGRQVEALPQDATADTSLASEVDRLRAENALLWEELRLKRPLAEYLARSDTRNWLKREAPQEIHLFMGMRDVLREYDKARGVDSDEE